MTRLFFAEGDGGVHAGGAAGGEVGGEEDDEGEQRTDDGVGVWVGWTDAEKEGAHQARDGERGHESDSDADGDEAGALTEDHAKDLERRGTESHANADFAGAARDGIGDDAIHADGGEEESDASERGEKKHGKARLNDGVADERGERRGPGGRQLRLARVGGQ